MFEPVRGGTRGGQAQFKWSDVSADKDREHYLGHSINAPTGRWQKNKDVHWYNRDKSQTQAERDEEIRQLKEMEAEALSVALGFSPSSTNGQVIGVAASASTQLVQGPEDEAEQMEKKKRQKAERKEEKRARKEARRAPRAARDRGISMNDARFRSRSRSPSRRKHRHDDDDRSRSRSPNGRENPPARSRDYDSVERERERERDRRRWNLNTVRDRPSARYRHD